MTPPDDRRPEGPRGLDRPGQAARRFRFVTVDVFTDTRFGGNPLAVFPEAAGLPDAGMSALAREFNLSETTFVLPPADPANTARVRIFARGGHEMPFAGHPNVGTAFVLGGEAALRFEEIAGIVTCVREAAGWTIAAPRPLDTGPALPAEIVARCAGLAAAEVRGDGVLASCGNGFVLAEVTPDALSRAAPDLAAFRAADAAWPHARQGGAAPRLPLYLWAPDGKGRVRARMFSPLSGTAEDAATGSAAAPLAAWLERQGRGGRWVVSQGAEMGRPSVIHAEARDGHARVGGGCVPVLEGWARL